MTQPGPVCKFPQGCHRVVPCDPGCGATYTATEPARRHTVDSITDSELADLYAQLDMQRRNFGRARTAAEIATARAEQAEGAIERVRKVLGRIERARHHLRGTTESLPIGISIGLDDAAQAIRAALDEHQEQP